MPDPSAVIIGVTSAPGSSIALRLLAMGWQVMGFGDDPERMADLEFEGGERFLGMCSGLSGVEPLERSLAALPHEAGELELIVCAMGSNGVPNTLPGANWPELMDIELALELQQIQWLLSAFSMGSAPTLVDLTTKRAATRRAELLRTVFEPIPLEVVSLLSEPERGDASADPERFAACVEWLLSRPPCLSAPELHLRAARDVQQARVEAHRLRLVAVG